MQVVQLRVRGLWSRRLRCPYPNGIKRVTLRFVMFVELLNPRKQAVFLVNASEVKRAETKVSTDEQSLIRTLRAQSQPGVEPEMIPIPGLAGACLTQDGSVAFPLVSARMGNVDQEYTASESNLIRNIAKGLCTNGYQLATFEPSVSHRFVLVQEAPLLMGG